MTQLDVREVIGQQGATELVRSSAGHYVFRCPSPATGERQAITISHDDLCRIVGWFGKIVLTAEVHRDPA